MSKLNQEELLNWFVNYINTRAIPLDHMKKFKQIVALIQRPEVTEEWIEEKAIELNNEILLANYKESYYNMSKDFIRSLVEEIRSNN